MGKYLVNPLECLYYWEVTKSEEVYLRQPNIDYTKVDLTVVSIARFWNL